MVFAAPQVLWAFLFLLIPIIIHLFLFRRTKKVYFSNVAAISKIKDETKSQNRLKHLLILLTRLLFLLFLILAFVQPEKTNSDLLASKSVIYIDNSYSLSRSEDGITGLDQIIANVSDYVASRPLDHEFIILTNDFAAFANHFKSKNETLDYLTEIGFSPKVRSASTVLDRIHQIETGQSANVHFYSDFQEATLDIDDWQSRNGYQYFFHQVSSTEQGNIHVDSLYLLNPFFNLGESNAVLFLLSNSGNNQSKEVSVRLLNDDKLLGSQRVTIASNSRQEVRFNIDLKNLSSSRVSLAIQDYPVVFDNRFLLAIPNFEKVKVAHVMYGDGSYIPNVFGNTDLFSFESFNPESLDFSRLPDFDLVVLEGVNQMPSWLSSPSSYDVVVIPSNGDVDLSTFSSFFNTSFQVVETNQPFPIRLSNKEHPFYTDFLGEIPENVLMPTAKPSISHRPSVNTLMTNEFGEPYLTVFQGNRSTYLFTSSFDYESTNLPEHSIFLPFMYRIAQRSMKNIGLVSNRFDEALVEVEVPAGKLDPIRLSNEDLELRPNHYFQKGKLIVELPPEGLANDYYYIIQNEDTLGTMAFNMPREESFLSSYSIEELEALFGNEDNVRIIQMGDNDAYQATIAFDGGTSYWKYALILALVLLLAEVFLLRKASSKFQA